MKDQIVSAFQDYSQRLIAISPKLLIAIGLFAAFVAAGYYLRRLFRRKLLRRLNSSIVASFVGEILFWIFSGIGVITAANTLGFEGLASTVLAGAGVSAIVFGFAFKDILENFLAGFLLAVQKPFKVGDIIEVEGYKGPVEALDLRSTRMRLADGRDIWIPNALMVKGILTNYTRDGLLRHEFIVALDTVSNVEIARNLILDYLAGIGDILKTPLPNVLVHEIAASSVNLKILFWINQNVTLHSSQPEARGESIKSMVMRGVKDLLIQNKFGITSSLIIEHKMNDVREPISVLVDNGG